METFYQLLGVGLVAFIVWFMYRRIKSRPDVFSRENMNKSLSTMGILALLLIAFIAFLALILKTT